MSKKNYLNLQKLITGMLVWYAFIHLFDVTINLKVFQPQDWQVYYKYLVLYISPFILPLCMVLSALDVYTPWERITRLPFGLLILVKAFIQLALVEFYVLFVYWLIDNWLFAYLPIPSSELVRENFWVDYKDIDIPFSIYFFVISLLMSFLRQVSRKFGPNNLWHMISGRYYKPCEQERVFMFLDLNDSTAIAEQLGHVQYSALIQACIYEINTLVPEHQAEIYQYVGDEIVLTWHMRKGMQVARCLAFYEAWHHYLQKRANIYLQQFGVQPKFKAGVSYGMVAAAEVGEIKRDIAFHGDVLNVGARLCSLSKELGTNVLFSSQFYQKLPDTQKLQFKHLGQYRLKGRKVKEDVYSAAP